MALPYKRKLLYLESDGNQFVDTGVSVPSETFERAEVNFSVVNAISTSFYIGSGWSNSALCVANGSSSGSFQIARFSSGYLSMSYILLKRNIIVFDKTHITLNGNSTALALTQTRNTTFKIFGSSVTSYKSAMRFYSAKVVCGGETILDLIPVIDNNDVPCIYNKANGEFYYNTGTGQFSYMYNQTILTEGLSTRFNPLGKNVHLTAKSYIQDGLVAIWDGIENLDWGIGDDSTTMTNLVDGTRIISPTGITRGTDFFESTANNTLVLEKITIDSTVYTLESVGYLPYRPSNMANLSGSFQVLGVGSISMWRRDASMAGICIGAVTLLDRTIRYWGTPANISDAITEADNESFGVPKNRSCVLTVADSLSTDNIKPFLNGEPRGIHILSYSESVSQEKLGNIVFPAATSSTPRANCLRVYNRALTDEEIIHNYIIDKERFGI